VDILKFTKKLEQFGEHLIRERTFETKISTCSHDFLECIKHIKGILKHEKLIVATLKV
jgi:hypothetical protein